MSKHKDGSKPKKDMAHQLGLNLSGESSPENIPLFDADACRACQACGLAQGVRTKVVIGSGSYAAPMLLIGEAPGQEEDKFGKPFVGSSGVLLKGLMTKAGFDTRCDCFITNMVKCRPPNNRNPRVEEIAACRHWLEREIYTVGPRVILTAGAVSTGFLLGLGKGFKITKLRGSWQFYKEIPVMPILHPAYLLRNETKNGLSPMSKLTIKDLEKARKLALDTTDH
ncbi:uracil-DNA glycosylase [cyanobiont of Ornithocercus magnificus]|nr:uracil-DNA glycosylase [cyanobiont of Ornithocercus magnificus]